MPVKDDGKSSNVASAGANGKPKKNRYSLKKLLDRSRFSPRLLRITRLTKSVDCDRELDNADVKNAANLGVDSPSVGQSFPPASSPPQSRQFAASVPLDPLNTFSHSNSECRTPTCLSNGTSPNHEHIVVEEEYEESLSQFADLVIEGLKVDRSFRTNPSSDPSVNRSVNAESDGVFIPPTCRDLISSVDLMGGELTPPINFGFMQHIPPVSFGQNNPSDIYNEPCDAKPSKDGAPSEPTTIYTTMDLAHLNSSHAEHKLVLDSVSAKNSPRSSISSVSDPESRSLQVPPPQIHPSELCTSANGKPLPNRVSSRSAEIVPLSKATNGLGDKQRVTSTSSPTQLQQSVGFVDAPRGNSVIVHHPASPFARVPRPVPVGNSGKNSNHVDSHSDSKLVSSTESVGLIPTRPLSNVIEDQQMTSSPSLPGSSTTGCSYARLANSNPTVGGHANDHTSDLGGLETTTGSALANNITSSTEGFPPPPAVNNEKTRNPSTGRSRANADSHPTYEEAWDVKMARQLGFGISRLGPLGVSGTHNIPSSTSWNSRISSGLTTGHASSNPPTNGVARNSLAHEKQTSSDTHGGMEVQSRSGHGDFRPTSPKSSDQNGCDQRQRKSNKEDADKSAHPERPTLTFHENRLFNERSYKIKPNSECKVLQSVDSVASPSSSEYDYAYNGSWSMGVKLNLSLAMNGNSELSDGNSSRRLPPVPLAPVPKQASVPQGHPSVASPAVPAHQNQLNQRLLHIGPPRTSIKGEECSRGRIPGRPTAAPCPVADFDNQSSDSYEESWDTRHGRVISELTSSRVVDPAVVLMSAGLSSAPPAKARSSVSGVPSAPSSALTSPHHQRIGRTSDTLQPSVRIPSPVMSESANKIPPRTTELDPSLEGLPLEEQPWYHPSLTRSEAEELLRNEPEGSFLVRDSETCPNDYSLTIKHKTYLHMKISRNNNGLFILGEYSQPYTSVPHMIYHYARTLVPVRGAESVTLTHPVYHRNA
ncbi:unnamed protein product [Calicophoron daubneyi]|uniref:SH2 domain-containing protein n=1 Tax=Calicophoron daubneyi TaxID=300641 RepID=A0AAV2T8I6_CALDB